MAKTLLVLDRQATARVFTFGSSAAGGHANLVVEKGTQATSSVVFTVKASAQIDGDLNVTGDLNITGSVNQQTVNNLNVKDVTITLNDGGTDTTSEGSGVIIEGTSGSVRGAITFDSSLASFFSIGNGTTQREIVDVSSGQTLTTKTVNFSNNTFTDTSAATGDLLYFNGTKYVRLAKGTANQQLRTNGTASNIEWFTPSSGTTTKAVAVSGTQDGSNKTFTLAAAVGTDTELIYFNGQLLTPGATNDYQLSGTTLTFTSVFDAPISSDVIRAYGSY